MADVRNKIGGSIIELTIDIYDCWIEDLSHISTACGGGALKVCWSGYKGIRGKKGPITISPTFGTVSGYTDTATVDYYDQYMKMKMEDSPMTVTVDNPVSIGNIDNGRGDGTVSAAGGEDTYHTSLRGSTPTSSVGEQSGTETAPRHYTTRYFIRIND